MYDLSLFIHWFLHLIPQNVHYLGFNVISAYYTQIKEEKNHLFHFFFFFERIFFSFSFVIDFVYWSVYFLSLPNRFLDYRFVFIKIENRKNSTGILAKESNPYILY